jgi:hypothetical protein
MYETIHSGRPSAYGLEIAVVLKLTVRVGLVIAVVLVVVTVFNRYHGQNCQMIGMGVAHADEDCLHQDAISTRWAEAQQRQLTRPTQGRRHGDGSAYRRQWRVRSLLDRQS